MSRSSRSAEQQGFEAIGRVSKAGRRPLGRLMERLFAWRSGVVPPGDEWFSEADWACLQQEPLRARWLLYLVVLAVIVLIVWSAFAPLDEVTRGSGRIIPSSQLQKVQSFDGGVVQEVLVTEGERVERGQLLMRIDPTRFLANFRENRAQAESLEARVERLQALVSDAPFAPSSELSEKAPNIVAQERELYRTNLDALEEQKSILREQLAQRRAELDEAVSRRDTAARELGMAGRELNLTRPLLNSGAVSEVEVLRLQRDVTQARGQRDQAAAQVERLQSAIDEAESKLREVALNARNDWRDALSSALADLGALDESSAGLEDRVRLSEIRSPVDGIVQRLTINTIGGVAQPGQEVVEVVPTNDTLMVEARIAPQDIAFLRPGQPATIKLTAYDFAIYGGLQAELVRISPDTITDDDGNTFYLVRVRTVQGDSEHQTLDVIPGMTAQVDIMTGKRTVMQYMLKPVLRAWGNALGER
ncbi:Type I secretion system membrane fusion protein PrsE [Halomonas sp. THAF12]|uniref:HlyD family type I secretion periplasmic adaptor subunit n=1 Tax=Halomonas sp. THAF12 TaxID=2587849 RepID=UPI0012682ACA|nr:HlyD family type I secretion periplasmic adaptor subunit [Halomonas sp. THAF12]QFT85227.1 Type I secretion system membrane fusion protein PrsE [Halomonas sp. THAF12]